MRRLLLLLIAGVLLFSLAPRDRKAYALINRPFQDVNISETKEVIYDGYLKPRQNCSLVVGLSGNGGSGVRSRCFFSYYNYSDVGEDYVSVFVYVTYGGDRDPDYDGSCKVIRVFGYHNGTYMSLNIDTGFSFSDGQGYKTIQSNVTAPFLIVKAICFWLHK